MKKPNLIEVVDRLGALKAAAADLNKEINILQETLKASGQKAIDGTLFRATVSVTERQSIDAEAVRLLLANPPMKSLLIETVRVVARTSK